MLSWCFARLHSLRLDRRAVTTIEYGLIAAMVALVIINGVTSVGHNIGSTFNRVASEL